MEIKNNILLLLLMSLGVFNGYGLPKDINLEHIGGHIDNDEILDVTGQDNDVLNFFDDAFKKFTSDNDGSTILLDPDQNKPSSNLNNKILSLFLEDGLDTYYFKGNAVSYTFSSILSSLSQKSEPDGESCYLSDIIEFNNKRYLCLGVMNIDNDGKCLIDQDHLRCYSLECGSDMRSYCLLLTRDVNTNTITCGECVECDNIDYDIQWVLHKSNNDVEMELYDKYSSFKAKNWYYIGSIKIVNPYGKLDLVSDDDIKNKLIDRLQQQMYPIRREIVEKKNKIRNSIDAWLNSSKFDLDHENNQLNSQVPDQNQLNNENAMLTAQKSELQKEIEKINFEKCQLNAEIEKLQEDHKALQNKNTEFETKKNTIEKSIQQYESKLNTLQQEVERLQETSRKLQKDTKALQNVKDDLENNNQTIENLTQEIDNLKKANKELNNENVKLKCEQDECDKNKQSVEELKKAHENQLNNLKKQNQNEIDDCKKQLEEKDKELIAKDAKLKLLQGVDDNYRQIVYSIDEFRKNCGVVGNNSLNVFDGLVSEQMYDSVQKILKNVQAMSINNKMKAGQCSQYATQYNECKRKYLDLRRKCSKLESELQALRNQPKK